MQSIFTYPNNASTHYIDPDYAGVPSITYTTSDVPLNTPVIIKTVGDTDYSSAKRFNYYGANNTVRTRSKIGGWTAAVGKVVVWETQPTGTATFEPAEGFYRRIAAYLDGTYVEHNTTYPTTSITSTMAAMSKFHNYLDFKNADWRVSMRTLWDHPLPVFEVREGAYAINNIGVELNSNSRSALRINTTNDAEHLLEDGDQVTFTDLADVGSQEFSRLNGNTYYVKRIGVPGDEVELYDDAGLTTETEIQTINATQDDWHVIEDNSGTIVFFDTPFDETYVDSDSVVVAQAMSNVTGTINPAQDSTLYLDKISNNIYKVYTDSGLTTDATITSETNFGTALSVDFTPGAKTLTGLTVSDSGLKAFLGDYTNKNIQSGSEDAWGFCRVKHEEVGTGTYTNTSGKAAPTTIDDTQYYTWFYDVSEEQVTIYDDYNDNGSQGSTVHAFTVGGSGAGNYVTMTIEFIDMADQRAQTEGGSGAWYNPYQTAQSSGKIGLNANRISNAWWYVCKNPDFYSYGNGFNGKQQTGASTFQFNVEYNGYYKEGDTTRQSLGANEAYPDDRWTGDSNYRLNGYTAFTGETQRGRFPTDNSIVFNLNRTADTYSAPATSTAAAEDNFDTDDEWGDTGYNQGYKEWPKPGDTHYKGPRSIEWRLDTNNASTTSQSGFTYVRDSGQQHLYLDVEYPPLTEDQFQAMYRVVVAAQGTFNPIYFNLKGNNSFQHLAGTTGRNLSYAVSTLGYTNGQKIVNFEGFPSNESNAFLAGEPVILADNKPDGNIKTVVNTVDANVFGEARVRLGTPLNNIGAFRRVYRDPYHIIVTLDDDGFTYTRGLDGYYRVSCTFKADQFRGA